MEKMKVKPYVDRLLHVEDQDNRFINLMQSKEVYFLNATSKAFSLLARAQYGKMGTVALRDSALTAQTKILADSVKVFSWEAVDGNRDVKALDKFKKDAAAVTRQKGFNPLFLSLGAIRWEVPGTKGDMEEILSPLVIYPISLVRSGDDAQPICIQFIEEPVFINPSFLLKLEQASESVGSHFPLPPSPDDINLDEVDFNDYFDRIEEYVDKMLHSTPEFSRRKFEFERDTIAIAKFNNPDICMYHDIKRNYDAVCENPLIRRIFGKEELPEKLTDEKLVYKVLDSDASQEEIIRSAMCGESLVVQGPPGTGKSQTVANIIASLLSKEKKVLFVSQKIAALSEVYNKLPAEIRPFLLRMDYEQESMKIDANQVFADLKNTLDLPRQDSVSILNEANVVYSRWAEAAHKLFDYQNDMMGEGKYLSETFFQFLDEYCDDLEGEFVTFDESHKFLTVTYREWEDLKHGAEQTQDALARMSDQFAFHPYYSAWYGVKPEYTEEEALTRAKEIYPYAEEVWVRISRETEGGTPAYMTTVGKLPIEKALLLSEPPKHYEWLNDFILDGGDVKVLCDIAEQAAAALTAGQELIKLLPDGEKMGDELCELAEQVSFDAPVSLLRSIWTQEKSALADCIKKDVDGKAILEIKANIQKATDAYVENDGHLAKIGVTNALINQETPAVFDELCEALKDYDGGKVGFFSFKLKNAVKKIATLTNGKCQEKDCPTFVLYWQQRATLATSLNVLVEQLDESVPASMRPFNDNAVMFEALEFWASSEIKVPFAKFLAEAVALQDTVDAYEATFGKLLKLQRMVDVAKAKRLGEDLAQLETMFKTALDRDYSCGADANAWKQLSSYLGAVSAFVNAEEYRYATREDKSEQLDTVLRSCKRICEGGKCAALAAEISAFSAKYMEGSAYVGGKFPLYAVEIWKKTAVNRSYRDNAVVLTDLLRKEYTIDYPAFLRVFLQRDARKVAECARVFKHSFLKAYLYAAEKQFGATVETFKRHAQEGRVKDFMEQEKKLRSLMARIIANRCASRYNPSSNTFAFLSGRNQYSSCRLLFKRKAREILMLKPCLVMSPSTVSQLLQADDYREFDVVILDEASQITPESCITALYRAKQCVIFGDEYQMPAMRHFVAAEKSTSGDLKKIASILDMIAQAENFPRKKLCSHFRSKTEMLIGYSQKRYYPDMITFPAVEPKSETCGFMPGGYVEGRLVSGVNEAEAQRVYQEIVKHFDKYYDAEQKVLLKSVGVVAFGTPQVARITELVEGDKKLSKCLADLKSNADVYEKVFFIRTIENVQGNEMDCIILSLTYGRNASGDVTNSFAQLNRKGEDDLGEKLFNVAVTRAKESVLLVRSVHATDIRMSEPGKEESNIAYLREYLANYERFSDVDDVSSAFVCEEPNSGFVRSVVSVLVKSGIEAGRIVTGYGVNEKSVRIPIAILSPDKTKAELGIWCESDPGQKFDYLDYTCRFPHILEGRGWKLYPLFAYEWVRNYEEESERLVDYVHANITM